MLVHNSHLQFRGADIRNILEFEEAFPDATVIVLEQNYRSTQTILDAANAVIANNLGRKPKELWTDQGHGEPIVRYHADDEGDEAQWVAHQIAHLHDEDHQRWGDVAVFYRTNAQSRVIEEHSCASASRTRCIGGTRFYDRREIKDALAYLRAVVEPGRRGERQAGAQRPEARRRRHARSGARRVGQRATGPFIDALRRADEAGVVGRRGQGHRRVPRAARRADGRCVDDGSGRRCSSASSSASGYVPSCEAEHTIEAEGRLENLAELVGVGARVRDGRRRSSSRSRSVADTDELDGDDGRRSC